MPSIKRRVGFHTRQNDPSEAHAVDGLDQALSPLCDIPEQNCVCIPKDDTRATGSLPAAPLLDVLQFIGS